jgi:hypothetical protein
MAEPTHYIISRSRYGWSVSVEADRLSDHSDAVSARAEARALTSEATDDGDDAVIVDLSRDAGD